MGTGDFSGDRRPRLPCLLLLDTSVSMSGRAVAQLNAALVSLKNALTADSVTSKCVQIGLISFGRSVETVTDFVDAHRWKVPVLKADGPTPMGAAIERGLTLLSNQKDIYHNSGISYYRPVVFLFSDGSPTDAWQEAAQLVKKGEAKNEFIFYAAGNEQSDLQVLSQISSKKLLIFADNNMLELFSSLPSVLTNNIVGGQYNDSVVYQPVTTVPLSSEERETKDVGDVLERTKDKSELWNDALAAEGVPDAERAGLIAEFRIAIARVMRPKWLGRLERGGERATLTAPQFLKRVHPDFITPDGTVHNEVIRAIDPQLMKAVETYIGQRNARGLDHGDAKGLKFVLARPRGKMSEESAQMHGSNTGPM